MEQWLRPIKGVRRAWAPPPLFDEAAPGLRQRLEQGAYILSLIDRLRKERGLPHLGENVERMVLERELLDLKR
ncbi:MAG: hypothetical protein IT158_19555 [Bryobacterales bacterium]|nr:hypothetical protein [Bryobacterales bacterium]